MSELGPDPKPKNHTWDPTTWTVEEVVAFAAVNRDVVRKNFLEDGDHFPIMLLLATNVPVAADDLKGAIDPSREFIARALSARRSGTGVKGAIPIGLMDAMRSPEAKMKAREFVASLAEIFGAVASIFISEVWVVMTDLEVALGKPTKEQMEDAARRARGGHDDLGNHPERREYVMFQLEHQRMGLRVWLAAIERKHPDDKHPTLGPWIPAMRDNEAWSDARTEFSHLLPTVS